MVIRKLFFCLSLVFPLGCSTLQDKSLMPSEPKVRVPSSLPKVFCSYRNGNFSFQYDLSIGGKKFFSRGHILNSSVMEFVDIASEASKSKYFVVLGNIDWSKLDKNPDEPLLQEENTILVDKSMMNEDLSTKSDDQKTFNGIWHPSRKAIRSGVNSCLRKVRQSYSISETAAIEL